MSRRSQQDKSWRIDFENDNGGDFPRRLEFVRGNWEIVEWQNQRFQRNVGPRYSVVKVPLPEPLPERFTIELDVHFPHIDQKLGLAASVPKKDRVHFLGANYIQIAGRGLE